jgi:conjugative transfer signal peptidase TraF
MPRRIDRTTLLLGMLVLAAVVSTHWLHLNISPSVPYGLYRLTTVPPQIERGMLVVLPVPPEVQAWHSRWVPLLKPVAALTGDTVCVRDEELWVEHEDYGLVLKEARRKPLPRLVGCVTLGDGEVFVASTARQSLDGRYFGVLPVSALTARAVPLLTW